PAHQRAGLAHRLVRLGDAVDRERVPLADQRRLALGRHGAWPGRGLRSRRPGRDATAAAAARFGPVRRAGGRRVLAPTTAAPTATSAPAAGATPAGRAA